MALQLINITKFYKYGKSKQVVIDDLTIKFPIVGLVGIIGKSGCGKSTLLNIIAGIEKPSHGRVIIDGHPLNYQQVIEYRKGYISYVYQFYNLVNSLTVKQNLILLANVKGVSLDDLETKLFQYSNTLKINHLLDNYPAQLSGGQKQRVGLIRAFLCDTPILLADEPTGALNESLSQEVMKMLRIYAKKHLVIVISHNQVLIERYTKNVIDLDKNNNYYDFSQSRYHKYSPKLINRHSLRIFFYVKQQLIYQKNKVLMMFASQIFIIISFVLLVSACNGGWLYIQMRFNSNPLKELIEVSKNDYNSGNFNQKDITEFKKNSSIDKVDYKLDFNAGSFKNDQEMVLNTYQISQFKYLDYQTGTYPSKEDQVLINQTAASKYKLTVGEIINFKIEENKYSLIISGIINDFINEGTNIYIDNKLLNNDLITHVQNKDILVIQTSKVDQVIRKYKEEYLLINYHQEYFNNYQDIFSMAYLVVIFFVTISFVISLILISIVLKTIYIERKRDTSLLLANGLSKIKTVRLFSLEAVLIGFLIGSAGSLLTMLVLKIIEISELSVSLFNIPELFVLPQYFLSSYDLYLLLILIYIIACYLAGIQAGFKINKMDISVLLKED